MMRIKNLNKTIAYTEYVSMWQRVYKRPTYKESGKMLQHPEGADEYGDCLTCGKTRLIIFNEPRKMCSCGYVNHATN